MLVSGAEAFPIEDGIEDRPTVLLAEGARPDALERPRVAVVGTRAATPHGLADAHELGGVLARAGVTVVSGLAIGIDAAAHEGALDAHGTVIGCSVPASTSCTRAGTTSCTDACVTRAC